MRATSNRSRGRQRRIRFDPKIVLVSIYVTSINWIILHYSCDKKKKRKEHTHSQEKRFSILLKIYIYKTVSYTHEVLYNQSRSPNDNLNTDTISRANSFETFIRVARSSSFLLHTVQFVECRLIYLQRCYGL